MLISGAVLSMLKVSVAYEILPALSSTLILTVILLSLFLTAIALEIAVIRFLSVEITL